MLKRPGEPLKFLADYLLNYGKDDGSDDKK